MTVNQNMMMICRGPVRSESFMALLFTLRSSTFAGRRISRVFSPSRTISHSCVLCATKSFHAGEERVFSLIRLNKTPYRSSLGLDGTLSSILTVKLHNPEPCYAFEPSQKVPRRQPGSTTSNTSGSINWKFCSISLWLRVLFSHKFHSLTLMCHWQAYL